LQLPNLNVNEAIRKGKLREDLFYRLNVIPILIPPLRERVEDIPYLANHFISDYAQLYKKEIEDISDDALQLLITYPWPGNVRELENLIEYAVVRAKANKIEIENLPINITTINETKKGSLKEIKRENPSELVHLLEKHKWNKTKVAKELGIGRTTHWRMLKKIEKS
jgi:transcriptional regulator with PAS, ATPase and Fis domain